MYRDPWPASGDMYPVTCSDCAGMGEALRCADDGTWFVQTCPECGQKEQVEE